jgi:hypothetical protein
MHRISVDSFMHVFSQESAYWIYATAFVILRCSESQVWNLFIISQHEKFSSFDSVPMSERVSQSATKGRNIISAQKLMKSFNQSFITISILFIIVLLITNYCYIIINYYVITSIYSLCGLCLCFSADGNLTVRGPLLSDGRNDRSPK